MCHERFTVVGQIAQLMCAGMHEVVPDIHIEVEWDVVDRWSKDASVKLDDPGYLVSEPPSDAAVQVGTEATESAPRRCEVRLNRVSCFRTFLFAFRLDHHQHFNVQRTRSTNRNATSGTAIASKRRRVTAAKMEGSDNCNRPSGGRGIRLLSLVADGDCH